MYMCNGPHTSSTNGACVMCLHRWPSDGPGLGRAVDPHQLPEGPAAVQDVGFLDLEVVVAFFSLSKVFLA